MTFPRNPDHFELDGGGELPALFLGPVQGPLTLKKQGFDNRQHSRTILLGRIAVEQPQWRPTFELTGDLRHTAKRPVE